MAPAPIWALSCQERRRTRCNLKLAPEAGRDRSTAATLVAGKRVEVIQERTDLGVQKELASCSRRNNLISHLSRDRRFVVVQNC